MLGGRTGGPYCAACNVSDGSRYYNSGSSSCLECKGNTAAVIVGIVLGALAAVVLLLLVVLAAVKRAFGIKLESLKRASSRENLKATALQHPAVKEARRLGLRAMNVYNGLSLRSKVKQLLGLYQARLRRAICPSLPATTLAAADGTPPVSPA